MSVKRECSSFSLDVSLTYLCTLASLMRKTGDNDQKLFVSDYARNQSVGLLTILLFCSVRNIRKMLQEIGVLISSNFPFFRKMVEAYLYWNILIGISVATYIFFRVGRVFNKVTIVVIFGSIRLSGRLSCILKYLFSSYIGYQKKETTAERRLCRYRGGLSTKRIQYHKHWDGRKKTNIKKESIDV